MLKPLFKHPLMWRSRKTVVREELGNSPFRWQEMARGKKSFFRSEDSSFWCLSTWDFFILTFFSLLANKNNRVIANSY